MSIPLEVFCCYAREDQKMLAHLKKHLMPLERQSLIKIWSDANLNAGVEWEKELHRHLESADIILLLISPNFIASDYCYSIEMKRAIQRHDQGNARVIPILLRPTIWDGTPFAKLQIVPKDAMPVTIWPDKDEAFKNVAESIHQVALELRIQHPLVEADTLVGTAEFEPPSGVNVSTQVINLRRLPKSTVILLIGLAFLIVVGGSVGIFSIMLNNQPYSYRPPGTPVLTDPLIDNSLDHQWEVLPSNDPSKIDDSGGACHFIGGAYHIRALYVKNLTACLSLKRNFSNFTFEAQMVIIKGDCGGLFFRSSPRSSDSNDWTFYSFEVCQDGEYRLRDGFPDAQKLIHEQFSAKIHTGLNQPNTIAVVANNNTFNLYVNGYEIKSYSGDSSPSLGTGKIGVEARPLSKPTEVVFNNVRVWTSTSG